VIFHSFPKINNSNIYSYNKMNNKMNIDKLFEAIQILVNEEVKRQLPNAVKQEIAKLNEVKTSVKPKSNGLSMAKAILGEDTTTVSSKKPKKQVTYTKNPMINQILNETQQQKFDMGDTEFRTANFDHSNANTIIDRAAFAAKIGYGDMINLPSTTIEGRPVNISNEAVQPVVKALNRDYTELVKRFNKPK